MNFYVMTLFPEMVMNGLGVSITGRAMEKGAISVEAVNIRDYSTEKHRHVDDAPYGGGAGMVMQPGPVCDCYEALCRRLGRRPRVLYMTPQGRVFNQTIARELSAEEDLVFLCGHYEGIDERALERIVTDHLSVGDYVLTGGELPAMLMIDCISRLVPGVLNNDASAEIESFHDNLLEYPQYTRPEVYEGMRVPEVLLSGHHRNIERWRREQSIRRTFERRPDLLPGANLSKKEREYLALLQGGGPEEVSPSGREIFLAGLERLHTTEAGAVRIRRNLCLETEDVAAWCREKILSGGAVVTERGKNWYVSAGDCVLTVNRSSYTLVTAHREPEGRRRRKKDPQAARTDGKNGRAGGKTA